MAGKRCDGMRGVALDIKSMHQGSSGKDIISFNSYIGCAGTT